MLQYVPLPLEEIPMYARRRGLIAAAFAVSFLPAAPSAAQDFPAKPIRYVVPYSPGTGQDIIARVLAPEMSKTLGQPFVIENRTGANTLIGYEYVAKQVPA